MDTDFTIVFFDAQIIVIAALVLIGLMLYQHMDKLFHRLTNQYLPVRLPFMSEHGTIVLDDAIRDEEQAIARRWIEEHPSHSVVQPQRPWSCGSVSCITMNQGASPFTLI